MSNNIWKRLVKKFEQPQRDYFIKGVPLILRVDGAAHSAYTRNLNKPFDEGYIEDMQQTAIYLCQEIQGAKLAYHQSDEISILVTDYDKINTDAYCDYRKDKIHSKVAGMASAKFNQLRRDRYSLMIRTRTNEKYQSIIKDVPVKYSVEEPNKGLHLHYQKLTHFDCRGTNYPTNEVSSYFLGRQHDAKTNSIQMLAQTLFSQKELHGKHTGIQKEMALEKGHDWNELHWSKTKGSVIVKNTYVNGKETGARTEHYVDDGVAYKRHPKVGDSLLLGFIPKEDKDAVIRNKWEVVETPETFTAEHFKQFI